MKLWDKLKDSMWKIYTITKLPYIESNMWENSCKVVFIELDWEEFLYDDELENFTDEGHYENAILFDKI